MPAAMPILLLAALVMLPAPEPDTASRELQAMAEAERAFARTCVEKGLRESFFTFFTEEGVGFQPGPVKIREAYADRPADAGRSPITLDWEPIYGDIAAAADIGYLTGPFLVTDRSPEKRPPGHGYYFSVWKRQADGSWRVAADMGIRTPSGEERLPRNRLERAPAGGSAAPAGAPAGKTRRPSLEVAEAAFMEEVRGKGLAGAYLSRLDEDARLHRNGILPMTSREEIRKHLETLPAAGAWETMHAEAAGSDDLGYTYGSYSWMNGETIVRKGYFLRVWRRDDQARWRIVADVTTELPGEE